MRSRYGMLEGWVSIVANLVLSGIKGALGIMLSSSGLIADALHSLSDMASSVVVIISFKVSAKPPDREHPFGHAKAEYVATLVVALMMVMVGFQVGQESLWSVLDTARELPPPSVEVLVVLVVLLLSKELMARFSNTLGRMIKSDTLAADGWHHRTDALSTGVVILGLGARYFNNYWLDGVAGTLVGLYIIYTGIRMAYDSISPLLGEMAPQHELDSMRKLVQEVPDVMNCHDLTVHKYGHFYFTTVHAELSDRMDVHKMHEVAVVVETRLLKRFPGECVVHIDPVNLHHPLLNRVSDLMRQLVVSHPQLVEFRDLNLWQEDGLERGKVEVSVEPETDKAVYPEISAHLQQELSRNFSGLKLEIILKVDFTAPPLTLEGSA